jgi:hypothetical protein
MFYLSEFQLQTGSTIWHEWSAIAEHSRQLQSLSQDFVMYNSYQVSRNHFDMSPQLQP